MSEDGKTKTIQQLDSGLCAMRLQESILLSIAQIEQRGNLVGVKGTFALQDGLRSCRWKMKAVEQGSERKGILVETITSHKEWPVRVETLGKPCRHQYPPAAGLPSPRSRRACKEASPGSCGSPWC